MGVTLQEPEYKAIKKHLKSWNPAVVAQTMQRSLAVVLRIKSTKDFAEYKALVRSEHIPSKKPKNLAKRVDKLEKMVARLQPKWRFW